MLSLLFQSGYAGRAELGLIGDDDLCLKVSADGAAWHEALRVDRATGGLDLVASETTLPAAAAVDLGAARGLKVALTGTGTVTSFGSAPHRLRLMRFTGALTLTPGPALLLPGGAALVTASGDTALATSDGSGTWRVHHYQRASGLALRPAPVLIAGNSGTPVLAGQTRFLSPGLNGTAPSVVYCAYPVAGTFSELSVVTADAPGAGESWTFTLMKLFSPTALSCTLSGTEFNEAQDLANAAAFRSNERWCIRVSASAGARTTGPILFALKFTPAS
ncbi:hypothetical protein [Methylobacterium crusticola]|uniref:hypothetical protein n=1 Tax=Methylobacterium crusticola TaxID=1697972 RepID=UPI001EE33CE7|nr:hypothetical protein [Methylobacterium crusticola]